MRWLVALVLCAACAEHNERADRAEDTAAERGDVRVTLPPPDLETATVQARARDVQVPSRHTEVTVIPRRDCEEWVPSGALTDEVMSVGEVTGPDTGIPGPRTMMVSGALDRVEFGPVTAAEWQAAYGPPHPPTERVHLGGMRPGDFLGPHWTWILQDFQKPDGFPNGTVLVVAETEEGLRAYVAIIGRSNPPSYMTDATFKAKCLVDEIAAGRD